jgi:hypothetical protein
MFDVEILDCTFNIADPVHIRCGRMSICKISNAPHYFVYIESGHYGSDGNWAANASEPRLNCAFSYVPDSTWRYIETVYPLPTAAHTFCDTDIPLETYLGYIPLLWTKSHVIDTWKLTSSFVRIMSRPIRNWTFRRFPEFDTYNVFSVIPYFGITDCIGYSWHHYAATNDAATNDAATNQIQPI